MKIHNMHEAKKSLHPYFEVSSSTIGKDITLERTKQLMNHLGNPEKKLKIVHIAGTSGKTSTTYYIAALLHSTGQKVGHTVSPHIDSLTERVQINGAPLSESTFCTYLGEFLEIVRSAPEQPTWFEVMIAFSFWVFAEKEQVDYAVIETGLGGLQDSTNVAGRSDKLCVITDIGFDHMQVLGDRIGAIAHQKAGIIHENNVALMYVQDDEVMRVLRYWVSQQEGAELFSFEPAKLQEAYKGHFISNLPNYQKRNWLLAWAAYRFVARRDGLRLPPEPKVQKTQSIVIPGRMQVVTLDGVRVVLDGAHNAQKMAALTASFSAQFSGVKPVVLLALKEGKEIKEIAPMLAKLASKIIITNFTMVQDLPFKSIDPAAIAKEFKKYECEIQIEPYSEAAFKSFRMQLRDVGLVTGSFYLISELRHSGLL